MTAPLVKVNGVEVLTGMFANRFKERRGNWLLSGKEIGEKFTVSLPISLPEGEGVA
jgi:hypothetical protein